MAGVMTTSVTTRAISCRATYLLLPFFSSYPYLPSSTAHHGAEYLRVIVSQFLPANKTPRTMKPSLRVIRAYVAI